jgi:hypothetical protein
MSRVRAYIKRKKLVNARALCEAVATGRRRENKNDNGRNAMPVEEVEGTGGESKKEKRKRSRANKRDKSAAAVEEAAPADALPAGRPLKGNSKGKPRKRQESRDKSVDSRGSNGTRGTRRDSRDSSQGSQNSQDRPKLELPCYFWCAKNLKIAGAPGCSKTAKECHRIHKPISKAEFDKMPIPKVRSNSPPAKGSGKGDRRRPAAPAVDLGKAVIDKEKKAWVPGYCPKFAAYGTNLTKGGCTGCALNHLTMPEMLKEKSRLNDPNQNPRAEEAKK